MGQCNGGQVSLTRFKPFQLLGGEIVMAGLISGGICKSRERAERNRQQDVKACPDEDWRIVKVVVVDPEALAEFDVVWEDFKPLDKNNGIKAGDVGYVVTFFYDDTNLFNAGLIRLRD